MDSACGTSANRIWGIGKPSQCYLPWAFPGCFLQFGGVYFTAGGARHGKSSPIILHLV